MKIKGVLLDLLIWAGFVEVKRYALPDPDPTVGLVKDDAVKMNIANPICPRCNTNMSFTWIEVDRGVKRGGWLCECKPRISDVTPFGWR